MNDVILIPEAQTETNLGRNLHQVCFDCRFSFSHVPTGSYVPTWYTKPRSFGGDESPCLISLIIIIMAIMQLENELDNF